MRRHNTLLPLTASSGVTVLGGTGCLSPTDCSEWRYPQHSPLARDSQSPPDQRAPRRGWSSPVRTLTTNKLFCSPILNSTTISHSVTYKTTDRTAAQHHLFQQSPQQAATTNTTQRRQKHNQHSGSRSSSSYSKSGSSSSKHTLQH